MNADRTPDPPPASCPVNDLAARLDRDIDAGVFQIPRHRRIAEEIRDLVRDVATGRAGADHIPAIEALARELPEECPGGPCGEAGRAVRQALAEHGELFVSHVATHNCAAGACQRLVPAPCQMTCPAGIDVPSYVNLIAMGRDAEAIEVIRHDNPFPWVCGLVCTRPCEMMCVRGRIDKPVSIKFLKAFAAEKALSDRAYANPPGEPDKGKKVCVVGAGPAGMSAAYYLALKGYGVRVVEALPMAGGMMMIGIPRYRLPREVIDREVAMIEALGVEFRYNTRFGTEVTLEGLRQEGFEAFFLAIGAHQSFKLGIAGEGDFPQVHEAIEFLRRVALGERHMPGRRVVVVGGGNVAIDAARTCLRLGSESVTLAYRRTRHEMPADEEEVEQAEEEGVQQAFLTIPLEVVGENGRVTALKCLRAEMVSVEGSHRKSPAPINGSEFLIGADAVISAIGQRVESGCLAGFTGLQWTRRDTIGCDRASMQTNLPGVFAAGDAVTGPATVVEAIGGGKRAAEAIDRYLSGIPQPKMPPVPVRRRRTAWLDVPAATKMTLRRPEMPLLNLERRRTTFQQVELGYSENTVREEARRCLRCDICLRCGTCVRVCRDKMGIDALQLGYLEFDRHGVTDFRFTEERCILCGACAANCPSGAMRMEERGGERVLSLCGTILNRQRLEHCHQCGAVLGPARYLEYVRRRMQGLASVVGSHLLCHACARLQTARRGANGMIPPA
jgi:NADPH-dependent glutamate synthase beta subunit-like oxidoreductase